MSPDPLLAGVRAGDPQAQQRLWQQRWGDVYAICAHVLRSEADAADVASTVLVDFMYRYAQRIEHPGAVFAYLRLMAVRRSLRFKATRQREVPEEGEVVAAPGTASSADEQAAQAALFRRLELCLQQLTPKARQTVALRFRGELTSEAIGELVGGSKQYIGRLITRSLALLRQCLQQHTTAQLESMATQPGGEA